MPRVDVPDTTVNKDTVKQVMNVLLGALLSLVSFLFYSHLDLMKDVAVIKNQIININENQKMLIEDLKQLQRGKLKDSANRGVPT